MPTPPPRVAWLPGWATDWSLWRAELAEHFPGATHLWIDYPTSLRHADSPWQIPGLQSANIVVAWSLGGLLALKAAPHLQHCSQLVLVAPAAWFCHPELGWAPRVVQRMAKRIAAERKSVLAEFAKAMGPCSSQQRADWIASALRFSDTELVQGLELLETSLPPAFRGLEKIRIDIVHGERDGIIPPELSLWLTREIPHARLHLHPDRGHWIHPSPWPSIPTPSTPQTP